ncbi:acyl-CoA thioester hydrolase [Saccharothrix tamanrassetensis]|uniref:Acyl-CoA thioester hydrolase n=1 Tax=Saccharothrix tamanrassetensis TaxID=1051531 RepID=A0A841CD23_9PSEU|nr:thioesterase family protein [Saccharothrix tamanrassetensis]MBB5953925.1 acyl-CoA thioester hydrolase [Saccharothrix tamanrassetensis]
MADSTQGLEVTIERRVEWHDTDAAGHQHHSAILRWVEQAEAELLRRHGLARLFGRTPRVRHEVDYRSRLWFGEPVRTRLRIAGLGRTSLRYEFTVHGESGVAAEGSMVVAHVAPGAPGATPWPDDVRAELGGSAPDGTGPAGGATAVGGTSPVGGTTAVDGTSSPGGASSAGGPAEVGGR